MKVMVLLFNRWGDSSLKLPLFSPVFGGKKGYFFSWLTFLFPVPVFMYVLWFCCAFFGVALKISVSQGGNAWSDSVLSYLGEKSQGNVSTLLI